ncbi:MAG: thioesterase [Bacteroidia bacterium]|nr:thioesterase family protein [Bacteroidales bacterium]NCD43019.1 thioesterase [Bacteroidia bacterium]MDD2322628.1 thioesterase family protein [Bacteroidales bacterium]MDD3010971.1 thioesterase family protein [Bacteroidales bacterium]MDY0286715.1 thioesterase family protein [Bacteroidales bacterium]
MANNKGIIPGTEGKLKITVKKEHTASHFGSGLIDVFATPAMIGFMEKAAQESIMMQLEEGFITLGTAVDIKHIKATPVGEKVTFQSVVTEVSGNKITFNVTAFDEHGQIGLGLHKRAIVHAATFIKTIAHE